VEPSWRDIDDETRIVAILLSDHMNKTPISHDPDPWFRYTISELTSRVRNANKRADEAEQKLERLTSRLEEIANETAEMCSVIDEKSPEYLVALAQYNVTQELLKELKS